MIFFSSSIDCSMISTFYGVKVFSVDEVEREKFSSLITEAAETRKAELEMEAQGVLSPLSREFSQAEEDFPCCFSIFALHLQKYIWLDSQKVANANAFANADLFPAVASDSRK